MSPKTDLPETEAEIFCRRLLCSEGNDAPPRRTIRTSLLSHLPGRILADMSNEVTGTVRGNTIALDGPIPPLEGQRVRVIVEPLGLEHALTADEQTQLLRAWADNGPQGPIDGETAWPDDTR